MSSLIFDKNNPGGRYTTAAQTPIPEVPAAPSTLREAAYRAQADQYLIACEGYRVELEQAEAAGDQPLAAALHARINEQKALYLARKAEIRVIYPEKE